ncbi:hypothetical protein [Bradyrhizobium sp. CCBAU 53415]|uniref:hypothetical protein n=1 Tax=Bradyrhizobium sp. CCBAU 53415 TaxID=1325119 RepID=UPI002306A36D|nr:hypothetical protein [Bradyrhizobium sp. CCBAU 53415]MDA9464821.1 hypothetical protein [Bradyrhizobium sp. CCBAU 53415]
MTPYQDLKIAMPAVKEASAIAPKAALVEERPLLSGQMDVRLPAKVVPPAIVVAAASAPTVVMPTAAAVPPPVAAAMTVSTFDFDRS